MTKKIFFLRIEFTPFSVANGDTILTAVGGVTDPTARHSFVLGHFGVPPQAVIAVH